MKTLKSISIQLSILVLLSLIFTVNLDAQRRGKQRQQRPTMTKVQAGQAFQWKTGRSDYSMHWDGKNRHFIVYLPQQYQHQKATPVVFMFHGTTGTGDKMYRISRWKEMADREGFIAVFPTSWKYPIVDKGMQTKWHSGGVQYVVQPGTQLMDDVGFVRSIIGSLKASLKVDPKRIYASGFSNGGAFVTSKILPELGDIFAAVGAGSGLFHEVPTMQNPPIPVYQMLGSKDDKMADRLQAPIPYDATQWINDSTYGPFIANALTALQVDPNYQHMQKPAHSTLVYNTSLNGGRGKYIFSLIKDMTHVYPNGKNNPANLIAAKRYWEFFKRHPKP